MSTSIFFSGWEPLARTGVLALLGYAAMLCMIRLSGNRTLAHLNAFDLIVTIALGSTLASVITSQSLALAQGVLAFGVLVALQFLIAWLTNRWPAAQRLLMGEPVLLLHEGTCLRKAMRKARITEEELEQAARSEGIARLAEAHSIVLETNGKLSVLR